MLNIDPDVLIKNININHSANGLSNFHKQLLSSWISISSINPTTRQEILTQYLFHNQHIKIDNKVITQKFIDNLSKDTRITHIIDRNNKLLTLPDFNAKFKINIPQWRYNSIISAIPQNWKSILKKEAYKNTDSQEIESNEPYIRIGRTLKTLSKITSKEIYNTKLEKKTKLPTAIETWVNIYPFLEKQDWNTIFKISFKVSIEPYLQSFQYKIINRILNCKDRLHKWKLKDSNICDYCDEIDTLEHHLFLCHASKIIWDKLVQWIHSNLEIKYLLTECEVIFGIPFTNSPDLKLINFLIILSKWYINNTKTNNKPLYFIELITVIREKITLINYLNKSNSIENEDWQNQLYDIF